MGLFGGFKAKFTKDTTAKRAKTNNKDEVVCLGYRVYSEFDSPSHYVANATPNVRKQPSAIKTVVPRLPSPNSLNISQSSTLRTTETQIVTNPKIKKSPKKKTPEINKPSDSTNSEQTIQLKYEDATISTSNLVLSRNESVELKNNDLREKSGLAINLAYIEGKTSSFNPYPNEISFRNSTGNSSEGLPQVNTSKAPKSILKYKSSENLSKSTSNDTTLAINTTETHRNDIFYDNNNYNKTLTVTSSKTDQSNRYSTETVSYMSAAKTVDKNHTSKVATYVHTEVSSASLDTTNNEDTGIQYSSGYSYSQSSRGIGNTSNMAASIFFEGEEEPTIQRPRRANLVALQNEEHEQSAEC